MKEEEESRTTINHIAHGVDLKDVCTVRIQPFKTPKSELTKTMTPTPSKSKINVRCRANMAHMRQPGPDYGLGFQVNGLGGATRV